MCRISKRHIYIVLDIPKVITLETIIVRESVIDVDIVIDAVVDIVKDIVIVMYVANIMIIVIVSHSHDHGNSYINTSQNVVVI